MNKPRLSWLDGGMLLIVGLMPFHAFLSVYAGHLFGHQNLWQSWKEIVLALMLAGALIDRHYRKQLPGLIFHGYNLLAIAFVAVALLVSLANGAAHHSSFWFGVKTDLEFLAIFGLA